LLLIQAAVSAAACLQDFSGFRVVADIGGGYGRLLEDIMDTDPGAPSNIPLRIGTKSLGTLDLCPGREE
jgi:hypothetical protein